MLYIIVKTVQISYFEMSKELIHVFSNAHPKASSYVSCVECSTKDNEYVNFEQKKILNNLISFNKTLQERINNTIQDIGDASQLRFQKIKELPYDNNEYILLKRKILYSNILMQQLRFEYFSILFKESDNHLKDAKLLIDFIQKVSDLNEKIIIKVDSSFFVDRSISACRDVNIKLIKLRFYIDHNTKFLDSLETPLWKSNFNMFFDDAVSKAEVHFDQGLYYAKRIPEEDGISKGIYFCFNPILKKIDDFISTIGTISNSEFIHNTILFCIKLIPEIDKKSAKGQCISLMFFYRIVFDRIYERNSNSLFLQINSNIESISKISHLPITEFKLPDSFTIDDENISIRDYFLSKPDLKNLSSGLENAFFVTNPIDALYYVNDTLCKIHKAGLKAENKVEEFRILAFDDMFSLFVGVFLSSDIPNIFSLCYFIDNFAPKSSLSSPFEYSIAAISSLTIHLKALIKKYI